MLVEERDGMWLCIKNDIQKFDKKAILKDLKALYASKKQVSHDQVLKVAQQHSGRWAFCIPFNDYSDWTEPLSFSSRHQGGKLSTKIKQVSYSTLINVLTRIAEREKSGEQA